MKVLILAGGLGTRISEETGTKPKPMVEIGGKPILWHIMKGYSYFGYNDFIILTGYKSHIIKEYFINYYTRYADITVDMLHNTVSIHKTRQEPWTVTMLYTGEHAMTGARIKKAQRYVDGERFLLTYGDGVSDVNISHLVETHKQSGKIATVTAVQPTGRFGAININEANEVCSFIEKPRGDYSWINGGFFVCEPSIFDYIPDGDSVIFEHSPLEQLARDTELHAYKHTGFWRAMDTLRDKIDLTTLWQEGNAPWALWQHNEESL